MRSSLLAGTHGPLAGAALATWPKLSATGPRCGHCPSDALLRHRGSLSAGQVGDLVDYVCRVGRKQEVFYLWRPLLRDPKDDMVAEVAVAGGAEAVVTHNSRDFKGLEGFGIRIVTPQEFLRIIGGRQ